MINFKKLLHKIGFHFYTKTDLPKPFEEYVCEYCDKSFSKVYDLVDGYIYIWLDGTYEQHNMKDAT